MSWAPNETLTTTEIAWWLEEQKVSGRCDGVAAVELGESRERAGWEEGKGRRGGATRPGLG